MEYFNEQELKNFFFIRFKRVPEQDPHYYATWARRLDYAVWLINLGGEGCWGKALAAFDDHSQRVFRRILADREQWRK